MRKTGGSTSRAARVAVTVMLAALLLTAGATTANAKSKKKSKAAAPITNCTQSVTAMNAALIKIAKARVTVRTAKTRKGKRRAKRTLKRTQARGNAVRAAIRKFCASSSTTGYSANGCQTQIDNLTASVDLLYTRKLQRKRAKSKHRSKRSKKTRRTSLRMLSEKVKADRTLLASACGAGSGDGSGSGSGGSGGSDGSGDTGGSGGAAPDTTPPGTVGMEGPRGATRDNTPIYDLIADGTESGFECSLDGAAFASTTAPYIAPVLPDGDHTVECRAYDAAGNVSPPMSAQITVDTVGPSTTVTGSSVTSDTTPTFNVSSSEAGSTIYCKTDMGIYTIAGSTYTADSTLAKGNHSVTCRSKDLAGNTGENKAFAFTVV